MAGVGVGEDVTMDLGAEEKEGCILGFLLCGPGGSRNLKPLVVPIIRTSGWLIRPRINKCPRAYLESSPKGNTFAISVFQLQGGRCSQGW